MGIIIVRECFYCPAENTPTFSVAQQEYTSKKGFFNLFTICPSCEGGYVTMVGILNHGDDTPDKHPTNLKDSEKYFIGVSHPASSVLIPDHVPDNITIFFQQGMDNLNKNNWDAAGAMFGKVIDITTKKIDPELKGSLYERIEQLAKKHLITPDLKDWAHKIRLIRNDALHEASPTGEQEAQDIQIFTDLFLRYVFTLPGILEERRNTAEEESENS